MLWYNDAAADAKLNRLIDGNIQVDRFTFGHRNCKTGNGHRAGWHQDGQDRLAGRCRNVAESLARDESHGPNAPTRILNRNDTRILEFSFVKCKIRYLFYRGIDISNNWNLSNQVFGLVPKNRPMPTVRNLPSKYSAEMKIAIVAGTTNRGFKYLNRTYRS